MRTATSPCCPQPSRIHYWTTDQWIALSWIQTHSTTHYIDWEYDLADAFAPWDELSQRLDRDRHDAVVVWAGENVSEATFLAMACHRLAGRAEPIVHLAALQGATGWRFFPGQLAVDYVAAGGEQGALFFSPIGGTDTKSE